MDFKNLAREVGFRRKFNDALVISSVREVYIKNISQNGKGGGSDFSVALEILPIAIQLAHLWGYKVAKFYQVPLRDLISSVSVDKPYFRLFYSSLSQIFWDYLEEEGVPLVFWPETWGDLDASKGAVYFAVDMAKLKI